jgi:NAD+ synthase (glutamine-hydrolysing)
MRIALAQLNPTVGDIAANTDAIISAILHAESKGAHCVVFPELAICGYPPKDLLLYPSFIKKVEAAIALICEKTSHTYITSIIGAPVKDGPSLKNAALVIQNGRHTASIHKQLLPTYDVFDETRYFTPGAKQPLVTINNLRVGLCICEDAWHVPYASDPIQDLSDAGAELIINISASPYEMTKENTRFTLFENHAKTKKIPLVMVNQVGGNDELLFDGRSLVFNHKGLLVHASPGYREDLAICDIESSPCIDRTITSPIEEAHKALIMGIRDYAKKSGFTECLIGLSGGIDSAVTAALAVEALGAKHVYGITMPSQYSSQGSVEDSIHLAKSTGLNLDTIHIKSIFDAFEKELAPLFKEKKQEVTEENLQARIRGSLLMAVSNKTGRLLLTTGNKSEMAVGYCTLYGDMNGGLAVIADLYKTKVYELARYINRNKEIIPESTITKPPSAELRPDQRDEDSLPPYPILDAILDRLIEKKEGTADIINAGFEPDLVQWITHQVKLNEYKRFQAAPVLKLTPTAFGTSRRMPIASRELL